MVRRMMSPGWMRFPTSSHTEMLMLPVLSATLHVRTSWPSFVFVTRPFFWWGGGDRGQGWGLQGGVWGLRLGVEGGTHPSPGR